MTVTATGPTYLTPGHLVGGRYAIGDELGRGGSSVVYAAVDQVVGHEVAIKLLVPPPAAAHRARERLRREVQAVRALSHTNIVSVFDFLDDGPWSFIVMERVAGPDLSVYLDEHGPVPPARAAEVAAGIADALQAAHRGGILHRDVKPSNILLDINGRPRLADFGSARMDGLSTMTETGGLIGTLSYLPPEVFAGRRADARADVYSLGVTLYVMLVGGLPEGGSRHQPPAPSPDGYAPRAAAPDVPDWLDRVVARATTADPGHRFATAHALADALRSAGADGVTAPGSDPAHDRRCVLCSGPDPLRLGICSGCGGAPGRGDTLLLVPRSGVGDRDRLAARIREVFGDHLVGADAREVVLGHAPLLRVSLAQAQATVDQLAARDIPVVPRAARRAWRHLPLGVYGTLVAVVLVSWGGWIGPAVALLLGFLAHLRLQHPAVPVSWRPGGLPAHVETMVLDALRALDPGTARNLLSDIVQLSLPLYRAADADGASRAQLDDFLEQACGAARVLADMDASLQVFDRQREQLAEIPPAWLDAQTCAEQGRSAAVQRFLEATAWLSRARSLSVRLEGGAYGHLAELAAEIEMQVRVQREAREEVEALLAAS